MTPSNLIAALEQVSPSVIPEANVIRFTFQEVAMMVVYDENADRMRLISPIMKVEDLEEGQLEAAMEANFHSVLDARYATSGDMVWAAFIHPLNDLTPELFLSAVRQVALARLTFGEDYTGGSLRFGGELG